MTLHKAILFTAAIWVAVVVRVGVAARADPPLPEPAKPAISRLDQRFITRCVRRVLQQQVRGESIDSVRYVPPELRNLKCQALVTLHEDGLHRGTGISQPAPVLDACRQAAALAVDRVARTGPVDVDLLQRLTVEIEVVGDPVPLNISGDVLLAGPVEQYIEPGVHGLRLTAGRTSRRICPSEFVAHNTAITDAVVELASSLTASLDHLANVRVSRFRTTHWYQRSPGGDVVELQRGLIRVPPEAVTAEALDAAAARIARYMFYRQLPSGRFSYAYNPSQDKYADTDNEVGQADAARALCIYARRTPDADAPIAAADRAAESLASRIVDLSGIPDAGFVQTPDGKNKLGATALTCLALSDHPHSDRHRLLRDKLVGGMLWLQRPSGKLITAFPPADVLATQELFPGQALLALARVCDDQPQQRIMQAFDRALGYYRELFRSDPSPAFAGWQTQAFAKMAIHGKRDDFADFAFTMADALASVQMKESNCPWPDKWGAIAAYQPGTAGIATASYLLGLCEALVLARQIGDDERARAYERAVRLGARFVMQLEFKPEETYYVRSLQDTVGGVRTSLIDNTLRIDNCSRALIALTRARDVLCPDVP